MGSRCSPLDPRPAWTTTSVPEAPTISGIGLRESGVCERSFDTRPLVSRLAGAPRQTVAVPVVGDGTRAVRVAVTSWMLAKPRLPLLEHGARWRPPAAIAPTVEPGVDRSRPVLSSL